VGARLQIKKKKKRERPRLFQPEKRGNRAMINSKKRPTHYRHLLGEREKSPPLSPSLEGSYIARKKKRKKEKGGGVGDVSQGYFGNSAWREEREKKKEKGGEGPKEQLRPVEKSFYGDSPKGKGKWE